MAPSFARFKAWFGAQLVVELGGVRIVHIDSADYFDEELEGLGADVVCLCTVGRHFRPNYVRGVVERLKPRIIIPCHWDWFFTLIRPLHGSYPEWTWLALWKRFAVSVCDLSFCRSMDKWDSLPKSGNVGPTLVRR